MEYKMNESFSGPLVFSYSMDWYIALHIKKSLWQYYLVALFDTRHKFVFYEITMWFYDLMMNGHFETKLS